MYSSFLPQSKSTNEVQLIVDSKVTVDVIGCLSLCVILAAVCQSIRVRVYPGMSLSPYNSEFDEQKTIDGECVYVV